MKLSPEQMAQVARYTMESRNKQAIAKLSSIEASISAEKCSQEVEVEIRESIANSTEAMSIQNAARSPTALWGS